MFRASCVLAVALLCTGAAAPLGLRAAAQDAAKEGNKPAEGHPADTRPPEKPSIDELAQEATTQGSVTVEGHAVAYQAIAGTLMVGSNDTQDAAFDTGTIPNVKFDDTNAVPTARMFYVAYFKQNERPEARPITFVYNGGPGSSTMWLHMGAFGPRRVVTADDQHTAAAPYQLVDNNYSLLDVSDVVFIDAPGTGFGRLSGKDKEKAFWGVDQDGAAFARFIARFVSKYQRWNSPKYLFGESYGTTRSAVLANLLEDRHHMDLNGVILLSQILSFDSSADAPQANPGNEIPYVVSLPTYAATAYYHHRLPSQPAALDPFLTEVEHFAMTDYAAALAQGSSLPDATRHVIAGKLHDYTGLPVAYIERADLRINVGKFNQNLKADEALTTGRLDSRFSGPDLDPLAEEANYDPQSSSISSAYVSLFNDYVRRQLKFGDDLSYLPISGEANREWDQKHHAPGVPGDADLTAINVMPDLAAAMKQNPRLKVMLNAGYYDLATPFFAAMYEMDHLPIPASLRGNIRTSFYESGHMVYVRESSLKELHDRVAAFIRGTYSAPKIGI
jgi:carboxypeptidase C (cathepsin A)